MPEIAQAEREAPVVARVTAAKEGRSSAPTTQNPHYTGPHPEGPDARDGGEPPGAQRYGRTPGSVPLPGAVRPGWSGG
ncbi:hypothetical protein GCM10023259_079630 [Thermocatellispora tengchongensis]